ncbi:MAG: 5-(carboxyamino)imidazole ribonucleotide synthase [Gammaproteobacteria bacterium]
MKPVLVLGHGQLGLMMAAAGARLGLRVDRLDTESEELLPGTSPMRLPVTAAGLLETYPLITAEKEHLPESELVETLRAAPAWMNRQAFLDLADREREKQLLDRLEIPTASWCLLSSPDDIEPALKALGEHMIIKVTRGGYDGRGQWRLPGDNPDTLPAESFGAMIAESLIRFDREVSLVGVRGDNGNTRYLPLAENVHHDGILRYSIAGEDSNPFLQRQAETLLGRIMDELDYTGVMAMECFEEDGRLLVNELAPRVHNSGHWSQLGTEHDQFALHLRALLDLPLPETEYFRPTLMLNLIGCDFVPQWLAIPEIQCHWYGKEPRPGRKLGHININAASMAELRDVTARLRPLLDEEHRRMLDEALAHYKRESDNRRRQD